MGVEARRARVVEDLARRIDGHQDPERVNDFLWDERRRGDVRSEKVTSGM
jgi:hypothetical protein